jgi:iron complex transport system substrate-binding protein
VRIVSLVPHATELLFALGLHEQIVAVTHECDYPPAALALPRVTRDVLPPGLSAAQIDAAVRARTQRGEAIYELHAQALAELQPDLIVTQALCPVCAVSFVEVDQLARRMPSCPRVISLDPHTLEEVLGDIRTLAHATARAAQGEALLADARQRIERVKQAVRDQPRPRVAALEWLQPLFIAGHWTPELIELAGGHDPLGQPGMPSRTSSWQELAAAAPELILAIPCGYDAPRAHTEALAYAHELVACAPARVLALDASAYFSRPGPRLIDGLELLAHNLHPSCLPATPHQQPAIELFTATR